MWYNTIKIIHVISASILLGTSLSLALLTFLCYANKQITLLKKIFSAPITIILLTITIAGFIQPISGFLMVLLHGHNFTMTWIAEAFFSFGLTAFCWLPLAYFQLKIRTLLHTSPTPNNLDRQLRRLFWQSGLVGAIAIACMIWVYSIMTAPPYIHY
jgi:uncharacterized membrane protein